MIECMLRVVLDTNSIHRDPWLTGQAGSKLARLANSGSCVLVYPEVVVAELRRQRLEAATVAHDVTTKGVEDMDRAGVDVSQTLNDLSAVRGRIGPDLDKAFDAVLTAPGILHAPIPAVATEDLMQRDLDRRRPFMEIDHNKRKKSVGFRDVLIWETVLAVLASSPEPDAVLFVTSDAGFLGEDGKTLHADLLEDVISLGIDPDRIATVKSIGQAIAEVEAQAPDKPTEDGSSVAPGYAPGSGGDTSRAVHELLGMRPAVARAELVDVATDALYGLVNESVSAQLAYGGDYDYPSFVEFTVPPIEDATITGLDLTTEFSFERSTTSPEILVGTANAVILLEGALFRGDWYVAEFDAVSVGSEINNHYLEASCELEVRVVVELDIEGGAVAAMDVKLLDPPRVHDGGDDTLITDLSSALYEGDEGGPLLSSGE